MKKLLVIIASAMFSLTTFSQTNKGTVLIDAQTDLSAAFSTSKLEYSGQNVLDDDIKNTTFNFKPAIGYFFANNFAAGLSVNVNVTNMSMGSSESKNTTMAFGPFVRYYFGATSVKPFMHGEIGYAYNKQDDAKFGGLAYGIGLGLAFVANEHIAFNATVNYGGSSLSNSEESNLKLNTSGVAIGLGFSIHL